MSETKHIKRIAIGNVQGIRKIDVIPTSVITIVGGENGAGKTSFIDAISYSMTGKPSTPRPLRQGETEGFVDIAIGSAGSDEVELLAQRRFFRKDDGTEDSELTVWEPDSTGLGKGTKYKSPQKVLDALIGEFMGDPLEFIDAKASEQVAELKSLVGYDDSDIVARHTEAKNAITVSEADITRLKNRLSGVQYDPNLPKEPTSAQAILDSITEANAKNEERTALSGKIDRASDRVVEIAGNIFDYEKQIKELEEKKSLAEAQQLEMEGKIKNAKATLESMPVVDTTELTAKLGTVNETNEKIRLNNERAAAQGEYDAAEAKRVAAENARKQCLDDYKTRLKDLVNAKGIGVDDVTIEENEIFIGGIPFGQLNLARQIEIWFKIAIFKNPKLRAFHIDRGESLLPAAIEDIRKVAEANQCQLFITRAMEEVDIDDPRKRPTIFIKDGMILGGYSVPDQPKLDETPKDENYVIEGGEIIESQGENEYVVSPAEEEAPAEPTVEEVVAASDASDDDLFKDL